MKIQFEREVIILRGVPVIGTVEVSVTGQRDRHDDWDIVIEVCDFSPETPAGRLRWSEARNACEHWLVDNCSRVQRKFDRSCVRGSVL